MPLAPIRPASAHSRRIAWQLFGIPTEQDNNNAVGIWNSDALTVAELHNYSVIGGSGIGPDHLARSPRENGWRLRIEGELAEDGKISLWVMSPDGGEEHHIGVAISHLESRCTILLYTDGDATFAVKDREWEPFRVMLPEGARVIDWVELDQAEIRSHCGDDYAKARRRKAAIINRRLPESFPPVYPDHFSIPVLQFRNPLMKRINENND